MEHGRSIFSGLEHWSVGVDLELLSGVLEVGRSGELLEILSLSLLELPGELVTSGLSTE